MISDVKIEEIEISALDDEIVELLKNAPTKTTAIDLESINIDDTIQIIEK